MGYDLKIGTETFSGIERIQVFDKDNHSRIFSIIPPSTIGAKNCACGYVPCNAGQDFEIRGLGFKPKGYAFMVCSADLSGADDPQNTTTGGSSASLIYCFYDGDKDIMRRVITTNGNYTLRENPNNASGTIYDDGFKQAKSNNAIYNVMAKQYFWVAWG